MKMNSGAELEITLAPFSDGRDLYQAVLEEVRALKLDPNAEVDVNLKKDIFCVLLASKKIEACIYRCMRRATYNKVRLEKPEEVFEPESARDDYIDVCMEVAKANILPFAKSLSAEFAPILGMLKPNPA